MSYQVMLRELRAQIIHETDPEKLLALVDQLQKLLAQKYDLAKADSPNQRPA